MRQTGGEPAQDRQLRGQLDRALSLPQFGERALEFDIGGFKIPLCGLKRLCSFFYPVLQFAVQLLQLCFGLFQFRVALGERLVDRIVTIERGAQAL